MNLGEGRLSFWVRDLHFVLYTFLYYVKFTCACIMWKKVILFQYVSLKSQFTQKLSSSFSDPYAYTCHQPTKNKERQTIALGPCSSRERTADKTPRPPGPSRSNGAAQAELRVELAPSSLPSPVHPHTWNSTALLLARSALFPASAMTMLGLACLCSSFTQFLARANVSWGDKAGMSKRQRRHSAQGHSLEKLELAEPTYLRCHRPEDSGETPPNDRGNLPTSHPGTKCREVRGNLYCVGDVIDHDGSLGPPIVHGGQAVIPLLSSCVPDLKFDCCVVQTDRLCEEGRCKRKGGVIRQEGTQEATPAYLEYSVWALALRGPLLRWAQRSQSRPEQGGWSLCFPVTCQGGRGLHRLYRPTLGKGRREVSLHLSHSGSTL